MTEPKLCRAKLHLMVGKNVRYQKRSGLTKDGRPRKPGVRCAACQNGTKTQNRRRRKRAIQTSDQHLDTGNRA